MRYVSTRGEAPALGFSDVVLTGLARDGGLYVPDAWPILEKDEIAALAGCSYQEAAYRIVGRFAGNEIPEKTLRRMIGEAYRGFRHDAVAPLVQIGPNHFLLELFHGPTLAFKDLAMQLLAPLMDHLLEERGARATLVAATSGDTGGAAVSAFMNRRRIDLAVLFPQGRVSDVQRRQMTTSGARNVQAIAVRGTFDDAQALVKGMFGDTSFRERVGLAAVNSINWGRVIAQIVYYFYAAVALGAPHRPVSFTVPTGNFGNIFAGYAASRMGLPVKRLIAATNVNDILDRALRSGRYEVREVIPTSSPSMDIQVSSNFERLLFEAEGRDAGAVRRAMSALAQSGGFSLSAEARAAIAPLFASGRADEREAAETIAAMREGAGVLVDPHTAVGIAVAGSHLDEAPMVTQATAHPGKFPDVVEAASGVRPELPAEIAAALSRPEDFAVLPARLDAVEEAIESRALATRVAG